MTSASFPLKLSALLLSTALLAVVPLRGYADDDRMAGGVPVAAEQKAGDVTAEPLADETKTEEKVEEKTEEKTDAAPQEATAAEPSESKETVKEDKAPEIGAALEEKPDEAKEEAKEIEAVEKSENTAPTAEDKAHEKESEAARTTVKSPEQPPLADPEKVDLSALESFGLLTNASEGALGIDMWDGSSYGMLAGLVRDVPTLTPYRVINDLQRRVLLTGADIRLASGARTRENGGDLLTLRIEKLIQMGLFAEAGSLYANNPDEPYGERLAHAGVTALLYSGRTAQACLEILAAADRFADVPYWAQAQAACESLFDKKSEKTGVVESELLGKALADPEYRYHPASAEDIDSLTALERGFLFGLHRVAYDKFRPGQSKALEPDVLALLLTDPNLPDYYRLPFMTMAVEQGIKSPADLKTLYESHDGGLPSLYKKAVAAQDANVRTDLLAQALSGEMSVSDLARLSPFAAMLAESAPEKFSTASFQKALAVMAWSGVDVPQAWVEVFGKLENSAKNQDSFLALSVLGMGRNPPVDEVVHQNWADLAAKEPKSQGDLAFRVIYEKFDNHERLSDEIKNDKYEKNIDLTTKFNYVMPIEGLLDDLETAAKNRRVGEVILLSSSGLRDAPSGKLHPRTFRAVLDGLLSVGLTNEARQFAVEAMLGLNETKEN